MHVLVAIIGLAELVLAVMVVLECNDVLADPEEFRRTFDFLWIHEQLNTDTLIIVLAIGAGVLGSFISAATSYVMYIGNRQLRVWWLPLYLARAPIGAALAVILYLVLRGGLVPTTDGSEEISPLGVAALAGLAGLAANKAVAALEKIFVTALGDNQSSESLAEPGQPKIERAVWQRTDVEGRVLVVEGSGFAAESQLVLADRVLAVEGTPERIGVPEAALLQTDVPVAAGFELRVFTSTGCSNEVDVPPPPEDL